MSEPSPRAAALVSMLQDKHATGNWSRGYIASQIQAALDAERAELEAQVAALTERLVRKDAPAAFTVAFGKMKAMAALLDTVPHLGDCPNPDATWSSACDCPACAWARLKACE